MKAAPAAPLEMVQPGLVLELLIIPLFGARRRPILIPMRRPHAEPREAGSHGPARALAPRHGLPPRGGQVGGQRLEANGLMACGAAQPRGGPAAAAPSRRRQGGLARAPHRGFPFDPDDRGEAGGRHRIAGLGNVAAASIGNHGGGRQALALQPPDLAQRDLSLRLERHLRRHAHSPAMGPIAGAALGQVQLIRHGETDGLIGQRHAHRHLAVLLLPPTSHSTAGPRLPSAALLREGRVVHDPRCHRPMPGHRVQHPVPSHAQHGPLVPRDVGDEVVHRLVPRPDMPGSTQAAMGSILLRSPGRHSPVTYARSGSCRSR